MKQTPVLDRLSAKYNSSIVVPLVEQLMQDVSTEVAQSHPLISKEAKKESIRKELTDFISGADIKAKFESGFSSLVQDLKSHLSAVEWDAIKKEWQEGVNKIVELGNEKNVEEPKMQVFQEIMGISDKTIDSIYASGLRYFEGKHYQQAGDIFFVLLFLDFRRYNVWLAYGLSEQKKGDIEGAINAFTTAAIMNPEAPLPYIFAAKCCMEIAEFVQARDFLKLAAEVVHEDNRMKNYIAQLEARCKSGGVL